MNSYKRRRRKNNINNKNSYNKTTSKKIGRDLIVVSLVSNVVKKWTKSYLNLQSVEYWIPQREVWKLKSHGPWGNLFTTTVCQNTTLVKVLRAVGFSIIFKWEKRKLVNNIFPTVSLLMPSTDLLFHVTTDNINN